MPALLSGELDELLELGEFAELDDSASCSGSEESPFAEVLLLSHPMATIRQKISVASFRLCLYLTCMF